MLRSHIRGRRARPLLGFSVVILAAICARPESLCAANILQINTGPGHTSPSLASFATSFGTSHQISLTTVSTLVASVSDLASAGTRSVHPFIDCTGSASSTPRPGTILGLFRDGDQTPLQTEAQEPSLANFTISSAESAGLAALGFPAGSAFDLDVTVHFGDLEDGEPEIITAAIVPLPPAIAMGGLGLLWVVVASTLKRRK